MILLIALSGAPFLRAFTTHRGGKPNRLSYAKFGPLPPHAWRVTGLNLEMNYYCSLLYLALGAIPKRNTTMEKIAYNRLIWSVLLSWVVAYHRPPRSMIERSLPVLKVHKNPVRLNGGRWSGARYGETQASSCSEKKAAILVHRAQDTKHTENQINQSTTPTLLTPPNDQFQSNKDRNIKHQVTDSTHTLSKMRHPKVRDV